MDGNGHTVSSSYQDINVENKTGITIKNINITSAAFGVIFNHVSDSTISDSTFNQNWYGINLIGGSGNTITRNTVTDNQNFGIVLDSSSENTIRGNDSIYNNTYSGIRIEGESSGNIVTDNTIEENHGNDIELISASAATVNCSNNLAGNTGSGGLPIGYYNSQTNLSDMNFSELILCNADGSNLDHITISGSDEFQNNRMSADWTDDSTFTNITSTDNNAGIFLNESDRNKILVSTFERNSYYGIGIYDSSEDNEVAYNTINENEYYNIFISGIGSMPNEVHNNTISDGGDIGLFIAENVSGNKVYNNNFLNNSRQIVNGVGNDFNLGAPVGGNYWDDFSCTDDNSDGICDSAYQTYLDNPVFSGYDYLPQKYPFAIHPSFYSAISVSSVRQLRNSPVVNDDLTILKILPKDWVIKVTSINNDHVYQQGEDCGNYRWYRVTDPTDGVSGWMTGSSPIGQIYLPYSASNQASFEAKSSEEIGVSSRPDEIIGIINHYYNDTNNSASLYSSDDNAINPISGLKNGGFPEKVVWGLAAAESGGITDNKFDNENISEDYGHGIMQITFSPDSWDNRGISSKVTLPKCSASGLYTNCYTDQDVASPHYRHYQPYGGIPSDYTYKQYTNKLQSMYANIKDAMHILAYNYNLFIGLTGDIPINGVTYTADDRKNILTTQYYNGLSDQACAQITKVANRLTHINSYFPGRSASDISALISKMNSAGTDVICADLHSPGDLSIQDSKGRTVGVINGKGKNDFPLALYDKEQKFVKILAADNDNYTYRVVGTGDGEYGLDIVIKNGEQLLKFIAKGIPIATDEIHSYTVDKQALLKGQNDAVTVKINKKGIDKIIKSGATLTGEAFINN